MQEDEPQPQAEPQTEDETITRGTDKWKPQKTELAVSWNTLLLTTLLQGRIDTDCVTLNKSSQPDFFLGFL